MNTVRKVELILQLMQSLRMSPDFLLYVSDFCSLR